MNRVQHGMRAQRVHTDDWLITYADMITLLLCFFVIFFVVLSSRKNGQEDTQAAHVFAPTARDGRPTQSQELLAAAAPSGAKVSVLNKLAHSGDSLADEAAARIGQPLRARPVTVTAAAPAAAAPKGDRIHVLEMSSSTFFGSGTANLSQSGKSVLRDVAAELKSDQYEGYHIVVEGHTDDTPIATAHFSSNWELSTARAAAVVRYFLDQGLPAQKLQAAGYADTRPKLPNRDAEGNAIRENQAQNCRVVIRLEKIAPSE